MIEGYNVIEIDNDWWTIEIVDTKNPEKSVSGTFTQTVLFLVIVLGITIEEVDLAVREMCNNDHDSANFGRYRTFIHTFSKYERKAS